MLRRFDGEHSSKSVIVTVFDCDSSLNLSHLSALSARRLTGLQAVRIGCSEGAGVTEASPGSQGRCTPPPHTHICIHTCTNAHMHATYTHGHMCAQVCARMHMHTRTHAHTHTYIHAHLYTHNAGACTHMHLCTHMHTRIHTYIYTPIHTCSHACTHMHM